IITDKYFRMQRYEYKSETLYFRRKKTIKRRLNYSKKQKERVQTERGVIFLSTFEQFAHKLTP
ncbi:MAG: hypothetical protein IKZ18_05810, partial [Bacteroidaceae bacterium]|nr:hypothetical protein [Bacteroidaceae bacterium]